MAQNIDIRYQEKAESRPLNQRFLDISGPSILRGYRTIKGSTDFTISLTKDGFVQSAAITPSGAKVEETTDLLDVLTIRPNVDVASIRVDSIYLKYEYGKLETPATYVVVEGTNIPGANPNKLTHLLLAYIYVQPNSTPIKNTDIISMPYGFSSLQVAGSSVFHAPVVIKKDLLVEGDLIVNGQSGGGSEGVPPTFIERLPSPIIGTAGQTDFSLPTSYVMNSNTLFVYKNGELLPPSKWMEVTPTSFRLFEPLKGGEQVWAFWYRGLNVYTIPDHNHDELYYRKFEIANRLPRYASDFFAGQLGRKVPHGLNLPADRYEVVGVTPIEKNNDIGFISVEKRENEIIVYNTGTYRGRFDLTYMVKSPFPDQTPSYQSFDWTIESSNQDAGTGVYKTVVYRRRDGTIAMRSTLQVPDGKGNYTQTKIETFNADGSQVLTTAVWAFSYNNEGAPILKTRIQ